ncbi:MAG: hypothetical protein CSB47_09890 [Proteobacteria bacterium]|nr:MAG: hypothetical protein CSB47_09890 [Pseudomonadota bacterium]
MTRTVSVIGWMAILTIITPNIMTSIKLIASIILLASSAAQAGMYRWVDESGKVYFSDRVPPSIAQKGHTTLNKNGVEAEHVVSAEVRRLKKEEALKKNQLAAELTEAKRLEEEQKRKDEQLLATYENREEIIAFYRKKLSRIDQSIGIWSARDESLSQKLIRLRKQREKTKDEMTRLTLDMQIKNAHDSLRKYRKAIKLNKADRETVVTQYKETLVRFDHLSKLDQ